MTTPPPFDTRFFIRSGFLAGLLLGALMGSGCSSMGGGLSVATVAGMSPAPQVMDPGAAICEARRFANAHPGAQVVLGSGDSMAPYYQDNTVVVIQKAPMAELRRGMTIVYLSREGWPVAHALVEKSDEGWVTMGINNPGCDPGYVTEVNYVGVVVKAYETTASPMLALSRELSSETGAVAMAR